MSHEVSPNFNTDAFGSVHDTIARYLERMTHSVILPSIISPPTSDEILWSMFKDNRITNWKRKIQNR